MTGVIPYALLEAQMLLAQTEADDENTVWEGWGSVVFVMGMAAITAIVVLVIVWQIMASRRASLAARETVAQDEAYRQLATESTKIQQRFAAEKKRIADHLADLNTRVGNIERILREVE